MSSQLVSIIPTGALTDDVFAFNQQHFLDIRNAQQNDLGFLSSPPVRAITAASDVVGSTATGVVGGVGQGVHATAGAVFGGIGKLTSGIPGGNLLSSVGQLGLGAIDSATQVGEQLVDPTKVVREHINYSNNVKDHLPGAINKVDTTIHDLSVAVGEQTHVIYENIPTQGVALITQLQGNFANVDSALAGLIDVLTKDNIEENLKVGQDKYKAIGQINLTANQLGQLSDLLPKAVQTIKDVKASFAAINANFDQAKAKINAGVTDPNQIFAQTHEQVADSWKAYEVKRKTMTYLPYNY